MTWHHRVSTVDADDQNRRPAAVGSCHCGDDELRPRHEAPRRDDARRRAESVISRRHRQARVRREHRRIPRALVPTCRHTVRTGLFTVGTGLALLGTVAGAIVFRWSGWPLLGLTLFVAGGASNWLDRVVRGSVIDFINVGVRPAAHGHLQCCRCRHHAGRGDHRRGRASARQGLRGPSAGVGGRCARVADRVGLRLIHDDREDRKAHEGLLSRVNSSRAS